MKRSPKAPPRPPLRLASERGARTRGNPSIDRQTRKLLGRHYAAKYRVR